MSVAYVTTVKDEGDIIYYQLCYYYNIGIRNFYILENGSTDNTVSELNRFNYDVRGTAKIHVSVDPEIGYWQYVRINSLAKKAIQDGHTHILPVDADELLFQEGNDNFNIDAYISENSQYDLIKFDWWYWRPTGLDNAFEPNDFLRITRRDFPQQSSHQKIIVKYKQGMEINQGNHGLHNEQKLSIKTDRTIFHAHFPTRSLAQLRKKITNFGIAYEKIKSQFYHQQSILLYNGLKNGGESFLQNEYNIQTSFVGTAEEKPFSKEMFELNLY